MYHWVTGRETALLFSQRHSVTQSMCPFLICALYCAQRTAFTILWCLCSSSMGSISTRKFLAEMHLQCKQCNVHCLKLGMSIFDRDAKLSGGIFILPVASLSYVPSPNTPIVFPVLTQSSKICCSFKAGGQSETAVPSGLKWPLPAWVSTLRILQAHFYFCGRCSKVAYGLPSHHIALQKNLSYRLFFPRPCKTRWNSTSLQIWTATRLHTQPCTFKRCMM
jgi:hypothetical protein